MTFCYAILTPKIGLSFDSFGTKTIMLPGFMVLVNCCCCDYFCSFVHFAYLAIFRALASLNVLAVYVASLFL